MGLRLRAGLALETLSRRPGWEDIEARIPGLEDAGLVSRADGRLSLTDKARPLLNAVLRELLG